MSKFVIRKAIENDAESLLKIYEPYITNTTITFEYDVPTAEAFADRIRETAAAFPYLVCECDGVIMGYATRTAFVSARPTTGMRSCPSIWHKAPTDMVWARPCWRV